MTLDPACGLQFWPISVSRWGLPLYVGHNPLEICLRDQAEDAFLCPRYVLRGKAYLHTIIAVATFNGYRLYSILCRIVRIASPVPFIFKCLVCALLVGFMLTLVCLPFVLNTPEAGKSSGGSLLGRSIGIAPPRLLHGRAASYGSIFDPVCCHGPDGSSPSFAGGSIARPLRGSWRSGLFGFAFQRHTGTYLMNDYSVVKVLREVKQSSQGVAGEKGQNTTLLCELFVNSGFEHPPIRQQTIFPGFVGVRC